MPPVCLEASGGVAHCVPVESVATWMRRVGLADDVWRVWSSEPECADAWWQGRALALSQWLTWVFDPWAVAEPYHALRVAAQYTQLPEEQRQRCVCVCVCVRLRVSQAH